ncbi:unnamed protein product [Symbiodinium sp. CCMP2592]|nr:unnamed protein product [Symbiodinium sp. CCMP2592]
MVAFSQPLRASTSTINLIDSDSEEGKKSKKIAAGGEDVKKADKVGAGRDNVKKSKKIAADKALEIKPSVHVKRERHEAQSMGSKVPRGHALMDLWRPHEGNGPCRGRRESPCVFGKWSTPAPAAPSGCCDLCDVSILSALNANMPARLTHVLNGLDQEVLEKGFTYVRDALGSKAEAEYRGRVQRARHRLDPARARRGPRPRKERPEQPSEHLLRMCCGRDGQACVFGHDLQPVEATPPTGCELCDPDRMKLLFRDHPGRLTGLLRVLEESALTRALSFMEVTIGETAAADFKKRVARARRRRDPERPKRKARGLFGGDAPEVEVQTAAKERRVKLYGYDSVASQMLEPYGESALDNMSLEQLWKATTKGSKRTAYHSHLAAPQDTDPWNVGAGISMTAAALLASIKNFKSADMKRLIVPELYEKVTQEVAELEPMLLALNFGKGSSNQDAAAGFRDAKRAKTTSGANVIASAVKPMDPVKAAASFRTWLLKEKSAFRSFLFILDFTDAVQARMNKPEARSSGEACDATGLFGGDAPEVEVQTAAKERRVKLYGYDSVASQMLEPYGESALDNMSLEQLWKATTKGSKRTAYHSHLAAPQDTDPWHVGAGISMTAAALLASIKNFKSADMKRLIVPELYEKVTQEVAELEPMLLALNFGKGSSNQDAAAGFRDAKRAKTTSGANVIASAVKPMDPVKAAASFRTWLLKEKSAFRSFLFILAGSNSYYTGHAAELVARAAVKFKPMSEQDFTDAVQARMNKPEARSSGEACDATGLFDA